MGHLRRLLTALGVSSALAGCGPEAGPSVSEGNDREIGALAAAITGSYTPPDEGDPFGIPGTPLTPFQGVTSSTDSVGRLPGGGGVTPNGSYSYTLPVEVLSGRAAMEPSISLQYNSRGGSGGVLGVGWSHRSDRTMITNPGEALLESGGDCILMDELNPNRRSSRATLAKCVY